MFKPPIEDPLFRKFCKFVLPAELMRARIEVEVVGDGLARLRALRNKRSVIISNHSEQFDPEVVFTVSKMLGEDFYWIAARECFDWCHGFTGWCFQRVGCYSVVRGEADLESFRTTHDILVNGGRKLVMFPEGEVTRQPDLILPLRRGVSRLFLEAQDDLAKKSGQPLIVQPIGIRWRYKHDVMPRLHVALRNIERRLRIVPPSKDIFGRLDHASCMLTAVLEEEYGAKPRPDLPFDKRVVEIREHILKAMGLALNVELPDQETHLDWLRRVNNALEQFLTAEMASKSNFQHRLHKELSTETERLRKDAIRVQRLIGITDEVGAKPLTPERLANKIAKLEREVLGKASYKGVRVAMVDVHDPFSLLDYMNEFDEQKDETVDQLTEVMQSALQSIIDRLDPSLRMDYAASLPRS